MAECDTFSCWPRLTARGVSTMPSQALPEGPPQVILSATQTDPAGNESTAGTGSVDIDQTAPDAPTIDALVPTNDTTPIITGAGEVGATVTVLADLATDPNGVDGTPETTIGTDVVGADGTWSIVSSQALPDGPIDLSATQTDPAGNESSDGTQNITIDISVSAPAVDPLVTNKLLLDGLAITGTGEIGATVVILIDEDGSGVADTLTPTSPVVDGDGNWSVAPGADLVEGVLGVVAYQIDEAGNISSLHTSTITIDRTAPDAPGIDTLAQTNIPTPRITGTGEVGATVTVLADLITDLNGVDGTPETEITDPAAPSSGAG